MVNLIIFLEAEIGGFKNEPTIIYNSYLEGKHLWYDHYDDTLLIHEIVLFEIKLGQ